MFDTVIIGGGIAGLTAAIYASRGGLKTLVIEKNQLGGQIINSNNIENYPGFTSISGYELINNIKGQLDKLNVEIVYDEVVSISKDEVVCKNDKYNTKSIIIATGLVNKKLGIEDEYIGKGVSYCATCDGNFFKGKDVLVIGGGNTALEDSLYLSNIVNKVYLVHRRDTFRGDKVLQDKVLNTNNIEVIYNANVTSINGDDVVTSVTLDNGNTIGVSGVFIAIGKTTNNSIFDSILMLDGNGFIESEDTTTNVDNIFVAGDTRTSDLKQLITAASDGAIAGQKVIEYINSL